MKTREFLQLESPQAMSSAIATMKNKEVVKHARKLAKMIGIDYEAALFEGISIVVAASDDDRPSQLLFNRYLTLSQLSTLPADQEATLTLEEQNARLKIALLITIFTTLMFILVNTKENLQRYRDHL